MIEDRRLVGALLVGVLIGGLAHYGISELVIAEAWEGKAWIAVEITYADGTVQTLNPRDRQFGFLGLQPPPLRIVDPGAGKEIRHIVFRTYAVLTYEGTSERSRVVTDCMFRLDGVVVHDPLPVVAPDYPTPPSGEERSIGTRTVTASAIAEWFGGETGVKTLTYEISVSWTIIFLDGTELTREASATAEVQVERVGELVKFLSLELRTVVERVH